MVPTRVDPHNIAQHKNETSLLAAFQTIKHTTLERRLPQASSRNACPNSSSATTKHLQGHSRSHTCCLNTSQSAIGEHHLIDSASLTSPTYTIQLTTSSAILKITTDVRGSLIKSDALKCCILNCLSDVIPFTHLFQFTRLFYRQWRSNPAVATRYFNAHAYKRRLVLTG